MLNWWIACKGTTLCDCFRYPVATSAAMAALPPPALTLLFPLLLPPPPPPDEEPMSGSRVRESGKGEGSSSTDRECGFDISCKGVDVPRRVVWDERPMSGVVGDGAFVNLLHSLRLVWVRIVDLTVAIDQGLTRESVAGMDVLPTVPLPSFSSLARLPLSAIPSKNHYLILSWPPFHSSSILSPFCFIRNLNTHQSVPPSLFGCKLG